jgi:predicted anti-sigma-YlaC factor YlaD
MLTSVPPSECSRAREAASARLDGELTELEGAHLDAHLLGCADCRRYLAEIAAVARTLRAAALEQPQVAVFSARRRRPVARIHVAAAAVVLAAVTVSSFALGQLIGAHGSGRTTTVGTNVTGATSPRQAEVLRLGRQQAPGRLMSGNQVIPV